MVMKEGEADGQRSPGLGAGRGRERKGDQRHRLDGGGGGMRL